MAMIDPSPSAEELYALSALFKRTAASLQCYLNSVSADNDRNSDKLMAAVTSLNNAADTIAVAHLNLASEQGLKAISVINHASAELQNAIIVRNDMIHNLGVARSAVTFAASIAGGDALAITN